VHDPALYETYRRDPQLVGPWWRRYFQELDAFSSLLPADGDGHPTAAVASPPSSPARPSAAPSAHLAHIARVPLFRDLTPEAQAKVAGLVEEITLEPGATLFRSGDEGDALYAVVDGELRVERHKKVLGLVRAGEVAGEMALADEGPRSADVMAHTAARLLKIPAGAFQSLMAEEPGVARGLVFVLARRLREASARQEKVDQLARSYRNRGHVIAQLDPLGRGAEEAPELELQFHGLAEADLDLPFALATASGSVTLNLRAIAEKLRNTYCRSIGVQFMHIDDGAVRDWLQFRMEETENRCLLSADEQRRILRKLTDAEVFETFIHRKFLGAKRFSLEGGESLIPLLDVAIEEAAAHGVQDIVIGMAHRGRLNVLANVLGKNPRRIFEEFKDSDPERQRGGGDVKYHMGYSRDHRTSAGQTVHLSLCFNPSHLEVVGPVVLGRVRAKQDRAGDMRRERGLGIVIHGDAAFAGQGVVQEILNMSGLPGYDTGGTLHVIVNNQIGFTTEPGDSRSSRYATDIARTLDTPIFHVNGEDPEAVVQTIRLALEFRAAFRRDVVIDMYCYRRHGHNEGDEPTFTQPMMYRLIEKQPSVREGYLARLRAMGGVDDAEARAIQAEATTRLEQALEAASAPEPPTAEEPEVASIWAPYRGGPYDDTVEVDTGLAGETLGVLLQAQSIVPRGFHPHPKLEKLLEQRQEMAAGTRPLDWAAAESLAFATLLAEGANVRLSGQDAQRGTFTHRHAVLHDVENGSTYVPLQHLADTQGRFEVWNSPLSETGVLGFDWGYSLDTPEALVVWEAQFGDFANVAQVIIDQFLCSAEQKWGRLSGLVLLLPHGFEGQGPEHSSARLERFLSLAAQDNIQVAVPTTPAQIFHLLRRQARRAWRKPLVVMSPKSLLRHPAAISSLTDLAVSRFRPVLADASGTPPTQARRLVLCAGKLYYDLARVRDERALKDVHLARVEQLYPFPRPALIELLSAYPKTVELRWAQEEPLNMGAWPFLRLRADSVFAGRAMGCIARPESASPAAGSGNAHKREQQALIDMALGK
jgi:2-oxoglutarate dehydrogenase E1 component